MSRTAARRCGAVIGAATLILTLAAHVGSPDVFFQGNAGPYTVRVVVRPPDVVPGIARVTVRTSDDVQRVAIRPVYWRAGSKGAPAADEASRLQGQSGGGTFTGSLWLMARGAYSVDVSVEGSRGVGSVLVPVASVATGQLEMGPMLRALLVILGLVLCAGLVTIVYKAAGESLVPPGEQLDGTRRRRARRVAAVSMPIIGLALFGGARWWSSVDREYDAALYRPSPLHVSVSGDTLRVQASDTLWQPPGRPSMIVPDHGKLMHLFMVRDGDATAFAHLHPRPSDSSANPVFVTRLPPLPPGRYHLYGDVVHETGFERTLIGSLALDGTRPARAPFDTDDAWYVGAAVRDSQATLSDSAAMRLRITPGAPVVAGRELTLSLSVHDQSGRPLPMEPYLGMPAHAVVARVDGQVYVHLHPMGTVTVAAQEAFRARDRGDTTESGHLRLTDHSAHLAAAERARDSVFSAEFPYAFPRPGDYRVFVQVKRGGRILTRSFAVAVADSVTTNR